MFLIGLTGGIAAGKSTVAEHWQKLGAHHIDADQLAREAVAPGSDALAAIRHEFGDEVFDGNQLDRQALARVAFATAEGKQRLEAIVHPVVQRLAREALASLEREFGASAIVVYNIPLLVETNSNLPFDTVVTVEAPHEKQVTRMTQKRGMSKAEAEQRIAAQASPIERASRADHILNSNQELALLLRDAEQLYAQFEAEAAAKAAQGSAE